MAHINLFYLFVTFSTGLTILGISFYLQFHFKDQKIYYFNIFYSTFTLIALLNTISTYTKVNISPDGSKFYSLIRYLENPVCLLILFVTLPIFIHNLVSDPKSNKKNLSFGIVAFTLLILNYSLSLFGENSFLEYWRIMSKDLLFFAMIFYCFVRLLINYQKLEPSSEKKFRLKLIIGFALFIPGIISDTFLTSFPQIKVFPFIYIFIGYLFFRNSINSYQSVDLDKKSSTVIIDNDLLLNKYNLTDREFEIISYLVEGKKNNEIAEQLFISQNTVKSHVRNVYRKLGINNRIELIKLLSKS